MIEQVCTKIFESCNGFGIGHFVWAPVPHLEEIPRVLDVERASPQEHFATKFQILQMGTQHFKARTKLPVKLLSLGDTEELLITKAKKRPCLIVATDNTQMTDAASVKELEKLKHLRDGAMILAPIYGTALPGETGGFPPIMTARIRAFLYRQFFYLPQKCPKTGIALQKDGIVRLDRLFTATPTRGLEPMKIKLAEEPMLLLLAVMRERFGGGEDENLKTVRDLLLEALPKAARPQTE